MKFEENMKRLEELMRKMEDGGMTLEDSIAAFEEGRKLADACAADLESIRQRIAKVTQDGATEEFKA